MYLLGSIAYVKGQVKSVYTYTPLQLKSLHSTPSHLSDSYGWYVLYQNIPYKTCDQFIRYDSLRLISFTSIGFKMKCG